MSQPLIPDQFEENTPKNHVPIIAQLGVLTFILAGIFGSLWYFSLPVNQPRTIPTQQYATLSLDDQNQRLAPIDILDIDIEARSAYVWDVRGQRALYKKNEIEALPLASITKLMTALVAHELVETQRTTAVSIDAVTQEGDSGLVAGEILTQAKLSQLALVSSSNDAAYALAAAVGTLLGENDATTQFIAGMNIRASELGLHSMEFANMTGLDVSSTEPGGIGAAKDVSFLMEHIVEKYPEILAPTQQTSARVYNDSGAYHDITNTNVIADKIPNLIGSKTGYTDLAGGNLTVAFDLAHNRPIIITVLGSSRDERFTDVLTLVEAVQDSVAISDHE